jgi:hypothetical protein
MHGSALQHASAASALMMSAVRRTSSAWRRVAGLPAAEFAE